MIKAGLQNEQIISELLVSGSQIIDTKNDFGVYMFEEKQTSDGIVFGKLQKPKYNETEVIKSIDTKIAELLPTEVPQLPETVLKFIYDAKVAEVADLNEDIRQLNTEIASLEGTISGLETELEALRIDMDNKDLLLAVAENNAQQATTKVQSSIQELQNAIQRATAESVQRVSAYARNESLKGQVTQYEEQVSTSTKQIDSLNGAIIQQNLAIQAKDSSIDGLSRDNSKLQTNLIDLKKSKKIICNELYKQGYLPQHIWNADEIYGEMMYQKDPNLVLGYMMWARHVVKYMKAKPQNTKWIYMMVKPWTEHMAYEVGTLPKDNWIGKIIHSVGKQYCYYVYDKQMSKRNKLSWQ